MPRRPPAHVPRRGYRGTCRGSTLERPSISGNTSPGVQIVTVRTVEVKRCQSATQDPSQMRPHHRYRIKVVVLVGMGGIIFFVEGGQVVRVKRNTWKNCPRLIVLHHREVKVVGPVNVTVLRHHYDARHGVFDTHTSLVVSTKTAPDIH